MYKLKEHLCRAYQKTEENVTQLGAELHHLTIYAGRSYAIVLSRIPRDKILGRSSRPASIHVYDIIENAFVLELRNVPTSVAVERLIVQKEGKLDHGQIHTTVRLTLQSSDAPFVRKLAELVRRVPKEGRIDRFSECGSAAYKIHRALLKLAKVLEALESTRSIERTGAMSVPQP